MIVDFHCHILPPGFAERHDELAARDRTYAALFPKPGGRIAGVEALLREMDAAGVDRAVAMGFGWTDQEVAKEVNDYLLDAGVSPPQLEALSFGEERPFESCHDETCWSKNRRAHFAVKR